MKRIKVTSIWILLIIFIFACTPRESSTISNLPNKCEQIGQTWISSVDGTTLVCVPAGEFIMGAAEDDSKADDDEKPQHKVYLDAYWIDKTEVTNINFLKCFEAGACHPKVYETSAISYVPYAVHPEYQNYPMLIYESEPAKEYCEWVGRRLPTEAEWEKAARGTSTQIYPWGNTALDCSLANYYECTFIANATSTAPRCGETNHCGTSDVESYPNGASPYGALNMAGNVWEWVADWYQADYYVNSVLNNPTGPSEGKYRVIRGGGTKSLTQQLRVTERGNGQPQHFMDGQVGFRCAMDANN